jgi:hypothetical protein
MRIIPTMPTKVKTPATAPVFLRNGTEPPPATTLVGLTLLEEELVTNLVEVEVTTLAGVELVTEVALVVELIDADVGVVVLELDVEELLEETDELEEVVEEVEVVLGRVDELSVLVLVVVMGAEVGGTGIEGGVDMM